MRCGIERGRGSEAGELADLQRSVGVSVIADGIEGYVIFADAADRERAHTAHLGGLVLGPRKDRALQSDAEVKWLVEAMDIAVRRPAAGLSEDLRLSPAGEVLRDIARGGIAGAIVGITVGGLGGRAVMRIAAMLHPDALGALTENGNRIGDITAGGTLSLIIFGLVACALAGVIWVIVSPWIPGQTGLRALLTAGIAIAIGTPVLIIGGNPDFVILEHDPVVVALLVALVGLIGLSFPPVDSWLDRWLPRAVPGRKGPVVVYAIVTLVGAVLVLPFVLLVMLASDEYQLPLRAGYALIAVGLSTAAWWVLRIRGRVRRPLGLVIAARGALMVAISLGFLTTAPHVARALG